MADEEDVVLTSRLLRQLLLLLHQENVDKDVDRVGCVSLGRISKFSRPSNPSTVASKIWCPVWKGL